MHKVLYNTRVFTSKLDQSVNWMSSYGSGKVETRYVRKRDDYIIAYVSSQSGCKMGCKQCFLTQQGQTTFDQVTPSAYGDQVKLVLEHYAKLVSEGAPKANRVNINFMARGEPLANKYVVNTFTSVYNEIHALSSGFAVRPKFNISTIYPKVFVGHGLVNTFWKYPAHIYYSLYSTDKKFRDHWLPNAAPVETALEDLRKYEEFTRELGVEYPVTFHWAIIRGHNDDLESVRKTAAMIKKYGFNAKFNLVRYNPHPATKTEEPDEQRLNDIFEIVAEAVGSNGARSYIVPRVGKDVSASCGMFIDE